MILHSALGAEAAHATTRVDALVALAGLGAVTVGVHHTLGLAALIWVAEVLWQTAAYANAVVHTALGVRTAFSRVTGVLLLHNWSHRSCKNWKQMSDNKWFSDSVIHHGC